LVLTQTKKLLILVLFSLLIIFDACAKRQNVQETTDPSRIQIEGKCVYGCNEKKESEKKPDEADSHDVLKKLNPQSRVTLDSGELVQSSLSDYILGPEDVIEVTVWKNEMLSKTLSIRPDGKISLPLIGDVQAADLTTSSLRESLKAKFKEFKENPEISVIVKEINSLSVYVLGEVMRPGKLVLRSETSLLQAITMSGGFTQFASTNNIVLLRRKGGSEIRKIIRYKDIISGKKPEDDVILRRGDTVVIP
jgi:polysaccharide biosynthesis/export protein